MPIFLFAVIVLAPQAQLRIGQVKGMVSAPRAVRCPGWALGRGRRCWSPALFVTTASEVSLLRLGTAATYAIVMLSLVLLTGYGGHVSLAQLSFAGVGALTYAKLDEPNLLGLLIAALVAAACRCPGRPAGAAADRALPGAVHAGLRGDHGEGRLQERRSASGPAGPWRPSGCPSSAYSFDSTGAYVVPDGRRSWS